MATKDKSEVTPDNVPSAPLEQAEPVAKGVFSFSKDVTVRGQTGKSNAFCSVGFPIFWEDDAESIVSKIRDAAAEAKAAVFEQLELDFTVKDGVVVELIKDAFDGTTVDHGYPTGQTTGYNSPPMAQSNVSNLPPYPVDSQVPHEKDANQQWARDRFAAYPGEFWDNRGNKRNPRAPDCKHKSTELPLWRVSG